jgi:hypothetical protein
MATHREPIDRKNPTFFLFLVDQSGSMSEPFAGQANRRKADGVADAINRLIQGLVFRSSMGNEIADRYYIGLIGYNNSINLGFGGKLQGKYQAPVSEVANNPLRIEERIRKVDDGAGGILEQKTKFQVWLEPVASGKTKMREALEAAKESVADFVASFPASFPPIVFNITDGMPTDATAPDFPEVEQAAMALRQVTNQNGSGALLFNMHISTQAAQPVLYPANDAALPDRFSKLLFRMSSPLTDEMLRIANAAEQDFQPGARGFVFQGDAVSVIQLLDIGTKVGSNR